MFTTGWAAPRRRSACRTADVLALKSHNLDATTFWSAPRISATLPSGIEDPNQVNDAAAVSVAAAGADGARAAYVWGRANYTDVFGIDRFTDDWLAKFGIKPHHTLVEPALSIME